MNNEPGIVIVDSVINVPERELGLRKYFISKDVDKQNANIRAAGASDAIDSIFEGAYLMLQILGGEVKYIYTTKQDHEVEMGIRIP